MLARNVIAVQACLYMIFNYIDGGFSFFPGERERSGSTEKKQNSRLLRRRLSRTIGSYTVLSPLFRSDKVVPVSYCRLGTATQVLSLLDSIGQYAYSTAISVLGNLVRSDGKPSADFSIPRASLCA